MPPEKNATVVGVILAGGRATRMGGGDKSLYRLGGKTILEHVIDRARPQVSRLVLPTFCATSSWVSSKSPINCP